MTDLKVAHAPPPPPVHRAGPPETKTPPTAPTPKSDSAHGPAVVLSGVFAKPPVKPAPGLQASQDRPNPVAPPKPGSDKGGGDRPGQHANHVI